MEIKISRTKVRDIALALIVIVCLFTGSLYLWKAGFLDRFPHRTDTIMFELPPENQVIMAVARMYTPSPDETVEIWQEQVCAGMTEQGCVLFQHTYAPVIWAATQTKPIGADQVDFVEDVDTLENGHHIWKLNVTTFEGREGETYTENNFNAYVEVTQAEKDEWQLDRVLFDQEAQARYGNKELAAQ